MSFATISSLVNPFVLGFVSQNFGLSTVPHLLLITFYTLKYPIITDIGLILLQIVVGSLAGVIISRYGNMKPLWSVDNPFDRDCVIPWLMMFAGLFFSWIYDQEGSSIRNDIIYHITVIVSLVLIYNFIKNKPFLMKIIKRDENCTRVTEYKIRPTTNPGALFCLFKWTLIVVILISIPQILRWAIYMNNVTWATVWVVQTIKISILLIVSVVVCIYRNSTSKPTLKTKDINII